VGARIRVGTLSPDLSRRRFILAGGSALGLALAPWRRPAAALGAAPRVDCPAANPIVDENWCTPSATWSDAFQLGAGGKDTDSPNKDGHLLLYPTATSVDRGEAVDLAVASYDARITKATLSVYRLGYYGGVGGRRVFLREHVPVAAQPTEGPDEFGLVRASGWPVKEVPAAALGVSGVYLARFVAEDGPDPKREMQTGFVVRDDGRARDVLVVMPTNTWQAYNRWGGKSLYAFDSNPAPTVVGYRGVKVSFDRPYANVENAYNWVLRCEFPLIWWLERQGYDVAYTDDRGLHTQPEQLLPPRTRTIAIPGHSEYWSAEMLANVRAARDAGTNVASFSANTAYWRVRYENGERTLVCFKTIEDGSAGVNDFGPDQTARGTSFDPLGPDGLALTADDQPRYATTTLRDRGAPAGDPNAPDDPAVKGRGRTPADDGDGPENRLFGVLFVGGADQRFFPIQVPSDVAGHRLWRNTPIHGSGGSVGADLIGWEWDAIPQPSSPLYARAAAVQPDGVERVTETPMPPDPTGNLYFAADDGWVGALLPPPGQGPNVHSSIYRAPSAALVFAAGTMQWTWGLGPHYNHQHDSTYLEPRTDSTDATIGQVTFNLLADMGAFPATPDGLILSDEPFPSPPTPAQGSPQPPAGAPADASSAPAGTGPSAHGTPAIRFGHTAIVSRAGVLHLRIEAQGESEVGELLGALTLETLRPVVRTRRHGHRRRLVVARRTVRVPLGREELLLVHLAKPVLRTLRRLHRADVDARLRLPGPPAVAAQGIVRIVASQD
jgi:N,N-dimethylformamidase beta subunit-like, C-terminal